MVDQRDIGSMNHGNSSNTYYRYHGYAKETSMRFYTFMRNKVAYLSRWLRCLLSKRPYFKVALKTLASRNISSHGEMDDQGMRLCKKGWTEPAPPLLGKCCFLKHGFFTCGYPTKTMTRYS